MTADREALVGELFEHATSLGVETGYWDVAGQWHGASVDAVLAVLGAMGAPVAALDDAGGSLRRYVLDVVTAPMSPVVTVVGSASLVFELCVPREAGSGSTRVELLVENGSSEVWSLGVDDLMSIGEVERDGRRWIRSRVELHPAALPVGYHQLRVEGPGLAEVATVLAAPEHVTQPDAASRLWGAFAPVYSLRSELGLGPDLSDLDVLGAWIDGYGGKVVATLPLLAAYLDEPFEPSPYSPVSRRFWNEVYLDVERLPELARSPAARARLDDPATQAEIAALRGLTRFDAARQSRLITPLLDDLTMTFFGQPVADRADFDDWVAAHPTVVEYGRFRAVAERRRSGWHRWPQPQRGGQLSPDDYDRRVAARHVYAQWSMHRQVGELSASLESRGQHLYLDLPVGAGGDGFDTWIDQSAYAWGTAVGAPPDDFFALGQNWGFPPLRPDLARQDGHRQLRACLRHHMRHAGMLRLDHVMGLHRLFWVPDGMAAADGVYVRSATEEQFAIVAIESQRAACVVVGEDLGTVPDEVREAMDRHRVLRSYVAEFAMPAGPGEPMGEPDGRMVATADTHDTPTFAAFVAGEDLRARQASGQLHPDHAGREMRARQRACDGLVAALELGGFLDRAGNVGRLFRGLLELLAESDAPVILVSLDDLRGETEPQNVPGTPSDRPNWVLRMPGTVTQLAAEPAVAALLRAVQRRRLSSHRRSPDFDSRSQGTNDHQGDQS
jgi:4-alpha-glucanotransferase